VSGSFVSPELRAKVRGLAEPIGLAFARIGLSPNALTVIGFLIACVAAIAACAQAWFLAGVLVIVGGLFDMFDGMVARATGKVSKAGAFLDSVFDRWGEGVVYVGIVVGCLFAGFDLGAILAAVAMSSAFMVSYTRARAESLGFAPGKGMANVGLAPREVRLVLLTLGLVLAGVMGGVQVADCGSLSCVEVYAAGGVFPLTLALTLIAALATVTTIQRIVVTLRQASHAD
jgi:CDP-diacylglycerol--glycerol-3-phosphate 3-phosphatidyltransferase